MVKGGGWTFFLSALLLLNAESSELYIRPCCKVTQPGCLLAWNACIFVPTIQHVVGIKIVTHVQELFYQ
jgi:hypothetical protein